MSSHTLSVVMSSTASVGSRQPSGVRRSTKTRAERVEVIMASDRISTREGTVEQDAIAGVSFLVMLSSLRPAPFANALAGVIVTAALLRPSQARAMPCVVPGDCPTNFCVDQVCCDTKCDGACQACSAVAKGSGADGTCGLAAAGKVCKPAYCGGALIDYIGPSKCDATGNCLEPPPVDCLHNEECKFDLCDSTTGCEQVTKLDGTPCGNGMECNGGVCGGGMSTSSSTSSSSAGAGGASGASSTASGMGGVGGVPPGGYPPEHPPSCGCHTVGTTP